MLTCERSSRPGMDSSGGSVDLELALLWIVLGLTLLAWNGLDDTIALLMLDCQAQHGEEAGLAVLQFYCAISLTLLVVAWPIVLLDMVQEGSGR